jgi:hypothetical protein
LGVPNPEEPVDVGEAGQVSGDVRRDIVTGK